MTTKKAQPKVEAGATLEMLSKELGRKNLLALPRVTKVSVHVGIGSMVTGGSKDYSFVEKSIADITGQKPIVRKSKKAISNFKLRAGLAVGVHTTLRGKRMNEFISRLVNVALPRVRDFRGITVRGMDGSGNYTLGLEDCTIFPEVNQENLAKVHGLQVNVCTTARNGYETYLLLKALGFPFRDEMSKEGKVTKKSQ